MESIDIPRYISASEVRRILTWPLLNDAVEQALLATSQTEHNPSEPQNSFAHQPARTRTTAQEPSQILFTMPAFVGNYQLQDGTKNSSTRYNTLACKLVTSFPRNQQLTPALPNILGNILLFNAESGQLQCIMDGTQITAWRTAAASIVATKYLYFKRSADLEHQRIKVAIIGCGVQGESHAIGMCATFNVSDVFLWNRTVEKAEKLAEQLRHDFTSTKVHLAATATDAVAEADVICVGTFAAEALVDYDMLKKRDVHINTVGAGQVHFGEVAQNIYDKARVYVDSWASAKVELKQLQAEIVAEVGEVMRMQQYPAASGITIFQSMGMATEDATVAQAVYEAFKKNGEKVPIA